MAEKVNMQQQSTLDESVSSPADQSNGVDEHSILAVDESVTRYVVVEINHNLYGMSTDSTVELIGSNTTQITRVPQSPAYIAGVINHRGTIIPVIDMRSLLGFEHRSAEAKLLGEQFQLLKDDHINWLSALQEAVYSSTPFTKATDPTKCNFGQWYTSVTDGTWKMSKLIEDDPILKTLVERFDTPHRKIHGIAEQVLKLSSEDRRDEAIEIINTTRETDLAVMCELFDQILEAIVTKLSSMMVITEVGSRKAAIAVDAVSHVVDCKDGSVEALPDTAENTDFLTGLVHQPDGSYILIADLVHIYNTACPEE